MPLTPSIVACSHSTSTRFLRRTTIATTGAAFLLIAGSVSAAGADSKNGSETAARYQREKAVCTSGKSNQDKATCLREAGAAYEQARQGKLNGAEQTQYAQNALERCRALPADSQEACRRRIENPSDVEGNAADGGILRKDVTIVPAY